MVKLLISQPVSRALAKPKITVPKASLYLFPCPTQLCASRRYAMGPEPVSCVCIEIWPVSSHLHEALFVERKDKTGGSILSAGDQY